MAKKCSLVDGSKTVMERFRNGKELDLKRPAISWLKPDIVCPLLNCFLTSYFISDRNIFVLFDSLTRLGCELCWYWPSCRSTSRTRTLMSTIYTMKTRNLWSSSMTGQRKKSARPSASEFRFRERGGMVLTYLRLDFIIMPLLTLGFFCLQLDRGNIANALTDNFLKDVKINQDQFNVGQQMLSLGIVLFEIPANMLLYRVGPGKWLTLQLFLFGTVSTFQAYQNSYGSFMATRFLLGMTESGFIPGGLWTLSTWYTRKETAKRVMFFYFGNQFGQASSKLLAFGILHMRGVGGHSGWFWLFVLMGSFTLVCGVILGLFLPDSFARPYSSFLPKRAFLTPREIHILRTRVLLDDPAKGQKKKRIGLPAFKKAVSAIQATRFVMSSCWYFSSLVIGDSGFTFWSLCATMDLNVVSILIPHRL